MEGVKLLSVMGSGAFFIVGRTKSGKDTFGKNQLIQLSHSGVDYVRLVLIGKTVKWHSDWNFVKTREFQSRMGLKEVTLIDYTEMPKIIEMATDMEKSLCSVENPKKNESDKSAMKRRLREEKKKSILIENSKTLIYFTDIMGDIPMTTKDDPFVKLMCYVRHYDWTMMVCMQSFSGIGRIAMENAGMVIMFTPSKTGFEKIADYMDIDPCKKEVSKWIKNKKYRSVVYINYWGHDDTPPDKPMGIDPVDNTYRSVNII